MRCAHVQAMAGLASDGRQIVTKARTEASNYRRYFAISYPYTSLKLSLNYVLHSSHEDEGSLCISFWVLELSVFCSFYGEEVPIGELCDRVANYSHLCTLYWWLRYFHIDFVFSTQPSVFSHKILFPGFLGMIFMFVLFRPFGSSAILGGYDRDGPQLYMIEPSGVAYVRLSFPNSFIIVVAC